MILVAIGDAEIKIFAAAEIERVGAHAGPGFSGIAV
jgi:hypothetical protein